MKRKAVVAMSGGVDSSVAAALMKQDGYDVTGIMLKLWKGDAANNNSGCCSVDAADDARRVAQVLDIPFYVFNFADRFEDSVINSFVDAYAAGETPNPCVECNRSVKFSALLDRAMAFEADVLATGHYARIAGDSGSKRLLRGIDRTKDQSYVLYMLNQDQLGHAGFPVGEYSKTEIRKIATELDLRTASKPESQEICFVPDGDVHEFLREKVPAGSVPGAILDSSGKTLGSHRGFAHYTVGQRRGLGVGLGVPLYVKQVDPKTNEVVVGLNGESAISEVQLRDVCLVAGDGPDRFDAAVATRYRGAEADATIVADASGYRVVFTEDQPAVAPGQAAVFYSGEEVLGGGTIQSAA